MSHEMSRMIVGVGMAMLFAGIGEARSQTSIDESRHHLGTAGRPEWREFAGEEPEGRALSLRFDARINTAEATLLIRQRDVKLGWDVRLNGRSIGRLLPMEAALVHAMAVPAGGLHEGANLLTIGPPTGDDDVIIEQVTLDLLPVRQALNRATLEIRVTEPGRDSPLPCRITVVADPVRRGFAAFAATSSATAKEGQDRRPGGTDR